MDALIAPPVVDPPRYSDAPPVTVVAVTETISSVPMNGRFRPGHYQSVLLNTTTGELSLHESTEHLEPWRAEWRAVNDVPRDILRRWHPGQPFLAGGGPHQWFEPVPEVLSWVIDSGVTELPYLDAAAANALLARVAEQAGELLVNLYVTAGHPHPGAEKLDRPTTGLLYWSAVSAHVGRNIVRLCSRKQFTAERDADRELVDFADIVRTHPQVFRPRLLRMPDVKLTAECEYITRFLGSNDAWNGEIRQAYGKTSPEPGGGSYTRLDVLGVRPWYLAARQEGEFPVLEFAAWDAQHGALAASGIIALTGDDEIERWAQQQEDQGIDQGVVLLGAADAGREYRNQQRDLAWDQLAPAGERVARLEQELAAARAHRRHLVAVAALWNSSDDEIGKRARMSRQAVHKIRTGPDETDDA
jgi:hypothetical protein